MDTKFATKFFSKFTSNGLDTIQAVQSNTKLSEDLPDGSCFSRILNVVPEKKMNCESVIKKCEYIGSFPVTGNDQNSRAEFVKSQLRQMQHTARKKRVLLVISITGIKVCSIDGKSVLMAHALRRISFVTCDPENRQFSFLAREPNGHFSLQYCHSFLAADSKALVWDTFYSFFFNVEGEMEEQELLKLVRKNKETIHRHYVGYIEKQCDDRWLVRFARHVERKKFKWPERENVSIIYEGQIEKT